MKTLKKSLIRFVFIAILSVFTPMGLFPCTSFGLKTNNDVVVGNNFDWEVGLGQVHINKPYVLKKALLPVPAKELIWVSKFGSVTFSQLGKEFAFGGMNEAGLVVTVMMLTPSVYPAQDNRYSLIETQWVQYQLDNFSSVEELLASGETLRISKDSVGELHFLVSDCTGNIAVIEFLNGKRFVYQDDDLPYTVLANSTYEESVNYARQFEGPDGFHSLPKGPMSLARFTRAAAMIDAWEKDCLQDPIEYCFNTLQNVSQGEWTQWTIVYDIKNRKVYYTTYANQTVKEISITNFDFSTGKNALYLSIDDNHTNNPCDFLPFNIVDYRRFLNRVFVSIEFYKQISPQLKRQLLDYPLKTEPVK